MSRRYGAATTSVRANGVDLGIETFGRDDDQLVLLVGGTTMMSWPDTLWRTARGRRVGAWSDMTCAIPVRRPHFDPENPGVQPARSGRRRSRARQGTRRSEPRCLCGVGVGGMVAQVAALDHPEVFSALTLVGTRAGRSRTCRRRLARPRPDYSWPRCSPGRCRIGADRDAVAVFRGRGVPKRWATTRKKARARSLSAYLGSDDRRADPAVHQANQLGMVFSRIDCAPRWRERLGELDLPTLVVHGRADPVLPTPATARHLPPRYPRARLLVLDDMGIARGTHADEVAAAMLALSPSIPRGRVGEIHGRVRDRATGAGTHLIPRGPESRTARSTWGGGDCAVAERRSTARRGPWRRTCCCRPGSWWPGTTGH